MEEYKIICGIHGMDHEIITDRVVHGDEEVWCDFELVYYPHLRYYKFNFETLWLCGFDEYEVANWIHHCLDVLTDYMDEHLYDTSVELNMWQVFTEGVDVDYRFKKIEEAYAWLKMMVYGFKGKGM